MQALDEIKTSALDSLVKVDSLASLEQWMGESLGKKSSLAQVLSSLKDLPGDERKQLGESANKLRNLLTEQAKEKRIKLQDAELAARIATEHIDITASTAPLTLNGGLHPITRERIRIEEIFQNMGFTVWDPFMVDDDYHNFESVNIPAGHPARDMWDTIRLDDTLSLIVHTSSMQNRIISSSEPPIRAIVPGKTFRHEATDARHEHSFSQVEGVYVDRGIKLSDMLGTLKTFLATYFERDVELKIQPTYFPFVEPGMEIMMNCPVCNGAKPAGCQGCSGSGWMEVIPCGPIHPKVIIEAGLDPNVYSGFAWGFGLDRLVMIKTGIRDVRMFHSGDIRFVNQF